MARDWLRWHEDYDTAGSSLARRLTVVRAYVERALTQAPTDPDGGRRLISMCAGDGRDVLPVLAGHRDGRNVRALLAELDPELAHRARSRAAELGLAHVAVRTADAGRTDTYRGLIPAHVVLVCGVFGNVGPADVDRTVAALPSMMVAGGIVIWTRGGDSAGEVRSVFADHGFQEIDFTGPADARYRVGICRLGTASTADPPARLFTFR